MGIWTLATSGASFFFGLIYPAYSTVHAIETGSSEDDTQWLIYWLCYSLLTIFEKFTWPALKWIPLYAELKALLLAWLVLPQTKGAKWMWQDVLVPGLAFTRKELARFPALEKMFEQHEVAHGSISDAGAAYSERKSKLSAVLQEVEGKLQADLDAIRGSANPTSTAKAVKAFDKDVQRIKNVGSSSSSSHKGY